MSTRMRRALLTLEIQFTDDATRPVLDTEERVEVLAVTWERGPAVDSGLSWHWFPVAATARLVYGATGPWPTWRYGAIKRDGSAPQWVRDAVAEHRPEDDGELALRIRVMAQLEQRNGGLLDPAEVLTALDTPLAVRQ